MFLLSFFFFFFFKYFTYPQGWVAWLRLLGNLWLGAERLFWLIPTMDTKNLTASHSPVLHRAQRQCVSGGEGSPRTCGHSVINSFVHAFLFVLGTLDKNVLICCNLACFCCCCCCCIPCTVWCESGSCAERTQRLVVREYCVRQKRVFIFLLHSP